MFRSEKILDNGEGGGGTSAIYFGSTFSLLLLLSMS